MIILEPVSLRVFVLIRIAGVWVTDVNDEGNIYTGFIAVFFSISIQRVYIYIFLDTIP